MEIVANGDAHIDTKLMFRLKMFILILLLLTGVLAYEMLTSKIPFIWGVFGISLGFLVGVIIGRIFAIRWHPQQEKVVGNLDLIGIFVLVLYTIFSLFRHWIFAHWFTGAVLTAFTVSFVEGAMLGRVLRMRTDIKKVLAQNGKI